MKGKNGSVFFFFLIFAVNKTKTAVTHSALSSWLFHKHIDAEQHSDTFEAIYSLFFLS